MATFSTDAYTDPLVGYQSKKALVDALRKREKMLAQMESNPAILRTAGHGQAPGRSQVNYGGILANAAKTYMQLQAAEDAAEQEKGLASERGSALAGLTPESVDKLTPAQIVRLQDMGIDVGDLVAARPKKEPLANLLQNVDSLTAESADVLAPQYGMDPEQLRGMIISAQERKRTEVEEAHKRELALKQLGVTPEKPSEFELYLRDPKKYGEFLAAKGGGSGGTSKFREAAEKAAGAAAGEALAGAAKTQFNVERDNAFKSELMGRVRAGKQLGGKLTGLADWAGKSVGMSDEYAPSNMLNEELSLRNQRASQYALDASEQLKGQGQVTESERAEIRKTQFNTYDTDEQVLRKLERIDELRAMGIEKAARAAKAYESGSPLELMQPSTPSAPSGESIEGRLKRIRSQRGGANAPN